MTMIRICTTAENDQVEAVETIGDFAIHETPFNTTAKLAKYRISHIPTGNLAHRGPIRIAKARKISTALSKLKGYPTKWGNMVPLNSPLSKTVKEIYKKEGAWDGYYIDHVE